MIATPSIFEALDRYFEFRNSELSSQSFKQEKSETMTAVYLLIESWGFERANPGRKITAADIDNALAFLKTVNIQRLLHAQADLEKRFDHHNKSQASRRTYAGRLAQFLEWAAKQTWWMSSKGTRPQRQCCQSRPISGIRHMRDIHLTHRTKKYTAYKLQLSEMNERLRQQFEDYDHFLIASHRPDRVRDKVTVNTRNNYFSNLLLLLGYFHRHKGVPLEELSFEMLVPVFSAQDIDALTPTQQRELSRKLSREIKAWLEEHFQFIRDVNESVSSYTRVGRINALDSLASYLYRDQVNSVSEYKSLLVPRMLKDIQSEYQKKLQKAKKQGIKVSDQSLKWPNPVEGETALGTLRRCVLEPLRLMCKPYYKNGTLRPAQTMPQSLQKFLKWYLMLSIPPRRQQDYRMLRISLCCEIRRPEMVPPDGIYFPLPPIGERERDADGLISDNYIARVYSFEGKSYPQGVWVLMLESYKTDSSYGSFSILIPNQAYDDGTHAYDYFEWYFCGRWIASNTKRSRCYHWWDESLQGQWGEWVSPGLLVFDPKTAWESVVSWRWQYAFPLPKTGKLGSESSYAGSFRTTSKQYIKKATSPHTLRYIWATWAFQVGLSEQQTRSLAYGMGHSVETLRSMYESCSQSEKLRPITEAIALDLLASFNPDEGEFSAQRLNNLADCIRQMSPDDQERLWTLSRCTVPN